ncbi:MAG: hypothetical protein EBV05_12290 [Cyanobacteria bacterium WB6_1B_304]|nr:hypothetical protein [Cyanobacteria bacterium WB6_1B_304]
MLSRSSIPLVSPSSEKSEEASSVSARPVPQESGFFHDLVSLLSNPQFQYFRQKYMTTWTDVETLFLYVFVSELISIEFKKRTGYVITPDRLISILTQVFQNTTNRRATIDMYREYQKADRPIEQYLRLKTKDNKVRRLPSSLFIETSSPVETTPSSPPPPYLITQGVVAHK